MNVKLIPDIVMNNTLCNGFKVLEFLAESGRSHSVKELAEHFSLPNSHICRLLKTLLETGYISQREDRRYEVSLRVLTLANACLSQLAVRNAAKKHLYPLWQETGFRVYLAVPTRGRALIVDVVADEAADELSLTIGKLNSIHYSACGKLCAAYASADELEELLTLPRTAPTAKTIIDRDALLEEFAAIRRSRFAVACDESGPDTYAVAAPVFGRDGRLAAAVGSYCATSAPHDGLAERVIACANAVCTELLTANAQL